MLYGFAVRASKPMLTTIMTALIICRFPALVVRTLVVPILVVPVLVVPALVVPVLVVTTVVVAETHVLPELPPADPQVDG
jgi:hypothetical protein